MYKLSSIALVSFYALTFSASAYEVNQSTGSREFYTVDTPYKISTLNLSLGLAFQFKRKGNKYE